MSKEKTAAERMAELNALQKRQEGQEKFVQQVRQERKDIQNDIAELKNQGQGPSFSSAPTTASYHNHDEVKQGGEGSKDDGCHCIIS